MVRSDLDSAGRSWFACGVRLACLVRLLLVVVSSAVLACFLRLQPDLIIPLVQPIVLKRAHILHLSAPHRRGGKRITRRESFLTCSHRPYADGALSLQSCGLMRPCHRWQQWTGDVEDLKWHHACLTRLNPHGGNPLTLVCNYVAAGGTCLRPVAGSRRGPRRARYSWTKCEGAMTSAAPESALSSTITVPCLQKNLNLLLEPATPRATAAYSSARSVELGPACSSRGRPGRTTTFYRCPRSAEVCVEDKDKLSNVRHDESKKNNTSNTITRMMSQQQYQSYQPHQ